MIELAPNHKHGLALSIPLIIAAGGFAPSDFPGTPGAGAFVTLPLTRRAHAGGAQPRVIEIPGGALVRTGAANPGLHKVLRDYARAWAKSPIPIIVSFASQGARDWADMAGQLAGLDGVSAIELQFNPTLDAFNEIRAVRAITELPILAKLDLDDAPHAAPRCVSAGANALVVARPPRVAHMRGEKIWYGRLYAPSVKSIVLEKILQIKNLKLDAPLIASGGVHSTEDVRDFIAAGASAVQVDSVIWVLGALDRLTVG
jgi:dihydroorotate dehydrogenase (NAD+) catalytic subunit